MTSSQDWGLARRIGFRFGVVFGALLIFPFPIDAIPKLDGLANALARPLVWATQWFAQALLGLPELDSAPSGSGDRTFDYVRLLLFAILGALGAIAWSALDRRRAHPRLAAAVRVVLRYYVAEQMLDYGFAKIWRRQFSDLTPFELRTPVGDVSPMGLLWRFMDYSAPYTVFGGLCEAVPGVLLLWRRTAAIGAAMVIAVMTNVVMLNFAYDVPVKLFSTRLLVMAALIALPGARRLLAAALGRAVAELPARVRMSPRRERLRWIAKLAFVVALAIDLYPASGRSSAPHELYANWMVDTFATDGQPPPPIPDAARWQSMTASGRLMIWLASGDRDPQVTPDRVGYVYEVDAAGHSIKVTLDADKKLEETWRYTMPAPGQLVIDAAHLGRSLHITLHAAPAPPLKTRAFHWINETPFSR